MDDFTLEGRYIRLEPLAPHHTEPIAAATAGADPALYQWSHVPRSRSAAAAYVATALEWKAAGTAVPFVTVRVADDAVIGSTRFFDLERWAWPEGHPRHGRRDPDVGEIGYTWLAPSSIRSPANTEAKLLMLTHAFEVWGALRICFHTDLRNARSRAALERIGGRSEGILRSHRLATDFTARDSARYSILSAEWPALKPKLVRMLDRR